MRIGPAAAGQRLRESLAPRRRHREHHVTQGDRASRFDHSPTSGFVEFAVLPFDEGDRRLAVLDRRPMIDEMPDRDPSRQLSQPTVVVAVPNRAQRLGLGLIDLETGELMDPGVS